MIRDRDREAVRDFFIIAGMLILLAYGIAALHGCGRPLTPQEKALVAEHTYETDLLACVEKSETLPASRVCRAGVRERWHVADGGTP